jgi:hypothetical protein
MLPPAMIASIRDIGLGCDADIITVAAKATCLTRQFASGLFAAIGIDAAAPFVRKFGSFCALNIQRPFARSIHILWGGLIDRSVALIHSFSFSIVAF